MKETRQHTFIHQSTNVQVSVAISTLGFYSFSFLGKYQQAHLVKVVVFYRIFIKRHLTVQLCKLAKRLLYCSFSKLVSRRISFYYEVGWAVGKFKMWRASNPWQENKTFEAEGLEGAKCILSKLNRTKSKVFLIHRSNRKSNKISKVFWIGKI